MLTEQEAAERWCPFVRYRAAYDDTASNRWKQSAPADQPDALNPIACRCIGSACMAWRWESRPDRSVSAGQGVRLDVMPPTSHRGYCGLAGLVTP